MSLLRLRSIVPARAAAAAVVAVAAGACSDGVEPLATAAPGVVFAFPVDGQLDVPTGARILVTFSEPIDEGALGACGSDGAFCLLGPDGPAGATPVVVGGGKTVEIPAGQLAAGTKYELHVGRSLARFAENLPASGPLLSFTTRSARTRVAPPTVIAVNGNDPARLAEPAARPMFETTTIRLVFSEPLDPKTVVSGANAVELVANGAPVPATVIAQGIHVAIDPIDDLTPDVPVEVRLGNRLTDLGGQPLAPAAFSLIPKRSRAAEGPTPRVLRTRQPGDPGPKESRAGAAANVVALIKPLIGREEVTLKSSVLAAEIGDPLALGGPIGFTIRRGQRLGASGIDVKLGGQIPVGLSTGDLQFELLTDGGGRLYRNPHQPAEQRPENDRAPLYVDLSLDLAIFATDPTGNAVLSQTILGVQATGTAIATDGVLAIETVASLDLGLLGVTSAPSNLVLELITSTTDEAVADTVPPKLVATYPQEASADLPVDGGIELLFDEPLDLDRLRAGGLRLVTGTDTTVPAAIESHGAAIVIRPLARLAYTTDYRVILSGVTDVAGNALPETMALRFATPRLVTADAPMTIIGISPGAPCAMTGATAMDPGRCAGGLGMDDLYHPFTLEQDQAIDVELSRPLLRSTVTLGATCNTGSVRVEAVAAAGGCMAPVPGTLIVRDRGLAFLPDQPWAPGTRYRFTLVSGGDDDCDGGELCSTNNLPANFDPLSGAQSGDAGGPNVVIDFTGAEPTGRTQLVPQAGPYTDINGSGRVDAGEIPRDANRAAMKITGVTGNVTSAEFTSPDCIPATPETEACMYLSGALPVGLGELTDQCPLPGGGTADSCVPVVMTPQAMYATSIAMHAVLSNVIPVDSDTNMSVMRIREPSGGPVIGYIIDGGGQPKLVVELELYMDAPDLDLPLSNHDLHSKPLKVQLEGPMSFLPDGRIAIEAANTADLPVEITISTSLGEVGKVQLVVPKNEMKLQLLSRPIRGGAR